MKVGVSGPIFLQKNIKGSMGKQYSYFTRWVKETVIIVHIYGARAISLLLCVCADSESA